MQPVAQTWQKVDKMGQGECCRKQHDADVASVFTDFDLVIALAVTPVHVAGCMAQEHIYADFSCTQPTQCAELITQMDVISKYPRSNKPPVFPVRSDR